MEELPTRKKYLKTYYESSLPGDSCGVPEKLSIIIRIE